MSCASPTPAGAPTPPPPKTYAGTCPVLVSGRNTISSGGKDREFLLIFPEDIQPGEQLPVAFLWHWLNASANSFATKGEVQAAANQQRFIAIIPEADDNALNVFTWPYTVATPSTAIQAELGLFDDLLSCVSQEFDTNLSCVSSIGVSAGALWTVVLTGNRSEYLSSAIVLSGGTDVAQVKSYVKPTRKVPELVLWGGPADQCVTINFQTASHNLEQHLSDDGHFLLECVHNCAHTEPPFDPPSGGSKYTGLWQFWLDHPYWLPAGQSPYLSDGIPAATPEWCAIGAGNATPRTGMCEPADCPF